MSDHEELEMSVAAWILDAVGAEEAEQIRLHVESCASCREAAVRLRRAAGALALEVEEVTPPARLRERVLRAAAAGRGVAVSSPTPARVVPVRAQPRPVARLGFGRLPAFAVAATVMLALLIGLVAGDLAGRSTNPPPQVARFSLVGHAGLAGARATVIDLKSDGLALIDFNGLPALEAGKVYEVWLITPGGRADAAGVFVPDSNGSRVVLVNHSLDGYAQIAITTEAGPDGTTAPTQPPQLYGTVT